MVLTSGTRLAQYEIVSAVGSGGMGVVYRARDMRLGRDVAVKVMAPHIAADPVMRGRFETEARAVASLSHPSILSIYELAIADGIPFAVMELLEGRNLRERMAAGAIPWREAVEIAASIADGLAAAHAKGVIHRDLKPENVFLTSDGHVKILDFGLALQRLELPPDPEGPTAARTAQGVVLGTFGYMSPEQVTGDRIDGRTDIFALGCLLYEMLAGRQLFTGATPQELLAKLLHDTAPDLSVVDPLAPQEVRAITARCVERAPARRFESAHDVSAALRALLSGSAVRMPRQSRARGKSLAVLPFVNAADPQLDYLTDGITESIINSLSQLETVRVVPRSVVFRYKGLQADPSTVGVALNAKTILTGRVSQHGDVLTIQAELVDTSSESQLWGE
ncbi:MAG: protein kinase domain-containing protein, partial [Vicinamibacterales bacterium]